MNTKGSITVLFLCFLMLCTIGDCSTCEMNKLEGDSLTLLLMDGPLKNDDQYTITKDNIRIVQKRNKNQLTPWIEKNGLLELQHAQVNDTGNYSVEIYDAKGVNIKSYKVTVCVHAKVPKPRMNMTCHVEKVDFRCVVESSQVLTYSWQENGKELKNRTLNFLANVRADNLLYTCTAHNPVHNTRSDPVEAECYKPRTLFGFDFWIMVTIIAGAGGLILLLMIALMTALVTVACLDCKYRQKQEQSTDKEVANLQDI